MVKDKKKYILLAFIISNFMIFLDVSVLPVALPMIQRLFHASPEELQWMVNSYLLALSMFVAFSGKISDIFGHKKLYIIGLIIFGFFSLMCGVSPNSGFLIISRFFQGVGAALLLSGWLPIQYESFPEKERGKIIGIITAAGSLAFTVGPFIGGFLTQYLSWHYIFLINVPISVIGALVAFFAIPRSKKVEEKIDYKGALSFMVAVFTITLLFMQGKEWGWDSIPTLSLLFLSLLFIFLLFHFDRRSKYPFIDFSLFKDSVFFCALVSISIIAFIRMLGVFWVIYFQNVLEFSPTYSGLLQMISALPMLFLSPLIGKFSDKKGPKLSILIGVFSLFISIVLMILSFTYGSVVLLTIALLLFGFGITCVMISSYSTGLSTIPPQKRGLGGGIINSFRNLGSTLGVAFLGMIFFTSQSQFFASTLKKNPETKSLNPDMFEGLLSKSSKALDSIKDLSSSIQGQIFSDMKWSFTLGMNVASGVTLALLIGVYFLIRYLFHPKRKKTVPFIEVEKNLFD